MSRDTLRIYVSLGDAGMLPEAERRIRQEAVETLQEAGVTAPDVETDAAPGGVIDESEAVLGGVSITVRIPPAAISDMVGVKIMKALIAAGFDPAIEPDGAEPPTRKTLPAAWGRRRSAGSVVLTFLTVVVCAFRP
jgi:hypothetical protein